MISCRGEQKKEGRKDKDLQRQRLLTLFLFVPSRLLRIWEAWNPKYEGSLQIEKGGQGFRKDPPLFPVKGRNPIKSSKGHNQPLYLCTYTFVSGLNEPSSC